MRTTPPAPIRPLAVVVAMCLCATACDSSPSEPPATSDANRTIGASAGGTPAPDDASPDEPEAAFSSPLNDFLNTAYDDVGQDTVDREEREYNEAVVDCMAAQGFAYTPPSYPDDDPDDGPWNLPPDEFVASYGYGLTTIDRDEEPVHEDPNQARIDAMSPAERTAYHRALYGELMPLDEDGYPDTRPVEAQHEASGQDPDMGCSGEAGEQVWGTAEADAEDDLARFEGLVDDMAAIHERVDQDPRVAEAVQAWRDCMADAGHPFDAPGDPRNEIHDRLAGLLDDAVGQGDDATAGGAVPLQHNVGDADPEALEQLRDDELELAAVDHRCTVEHGVERIHNAVRVELEQDFIDQHRDELEAYRDQLAAGGGGVG